MAEYRLHGFAEPGNTCKPALRLAACGAGWEPVFAPPRTTIADVSLVGDLDTDGADHPNTRAWLDRVAAPPNWKGPYDLPPSVRDAGGH